MNSEGRPRGIAHIEFANQETAVATVDSAFQEPIYLAGRDLRVDFAAGVRDRQPVTVQPSQKLYFSGLAGDESVIRTAFRQFGESIVDIYLCMFFYLSSTPLYPLTHNVQLVRSPQTGARSSAGFLTFENIQTAGEALEALNGTQTPDGDTLVLSYARPRRNQSFGNSDNDYRRGSSGSFDGNRLQKSSPRWNNEQ